MIALCIFGVKDQNKQEMWINEVTVRVKPPITKTQCLSDRRVKLFSFGRHLVNNKDSAISLAATVY